MTGKPVVLNLSKLSKKMVSSVYCKTVNVDDIQVKVFITNAFLDSVEVYQAGYCTWYHIYTVHDSHNVTYKIKFIKSHKLSYKGMVNKTISYQKYDFNT